MKEAAQLAGFLAADAVLRVATGGTLAPLIIFEKGDGTSHIIRIQETSPQKAAARAERMLRANADGAARGVMAFDAYLNLPQGRSDAIFLQAWQYVPPAPPVVLAVPYRHARSPRGFAVHRPKVLVVEGEPLPEADLVAAFFRGVDGHEKGGKFWYEHYEDSY